MARRFPLLDFAYAHRGLWSKDGPPENSLEAIIAAGEAGFGCELDVRPAACGTPVIFHDPLLDRMTGRSGFVSQISAEDMTKLALKGGGTLPTLATALDAWPGKTPLLIEMKIDGETDADGFARLVAELITQHQGPAALMSFSPRAIRSVPDEIMTGALIVPSMMGEDISLNALINGAAGLAPDYLACHVTDAAQASVIATDHALPVAVWTVASADMSAHMKQYPVAQIFEGFDPAFARPA